MQSGFSLQTPLTAFSAADLAKPNSTRAVVASSMFADFVSWAKMAAELGLERKSYQYIEKKISNINSSNVFVLYNKFHIPPMMVLNDDMGIWFGIVDIMKQLKPADKNEILRVLKKNL